MADRGRQGSMSAVTAIALAPWRLSQQWVSWWFGMIFSALSRAGVTPAGFVEQAKLQELKSVVSFMHIREDQYRKALKDLQEALDANEGDKKKALRCLKKTRMQLDELTEELSQLQAAAPPQSSGPPHHPQTSYAGLHFSAAVLLAAVWWFYQQDIPGLQRKLLTVFLFPLCWVYITHGLSGGRRQTFSLLPIYCLSWFLVGFIAAHIGVCVS